MTDRELLELAAKAAGIDLQFKTLMWTTGESYPCYVDAGSVSVVGSCEPVIKWNPLDDDGDALRLAVKLHITIDRGEVEPAAWCYCDYQDQVSNGFVEPHGNDPYAATRRAIVRAAAEIGKGMK